MTGFVYAMVSGDVVKIGYSTNPRARASQVRCNTPADIDLVGYIPGTVDDERAFHARLSEWRISGEWFRLEGAVVSFVESVRGKCIAVVRKWRTVTETDLAKALGVTPGAVWQWSQKRVPAERVLEVERITGIPRHEMRPDLYPPPDNHSMEAAL